MRNPPFIKLEVRSKLVFNILSTLISSELQRKIYIIIIWFELPVLKYGK